MFVCGGMGSRVASSAACVLCYADVCMCVRLVCFFFFPLLQAQVRFPPYLTDGLKDLLRKLLDRNVLKRLGAKDGAGAIKAHTWFRKIKWDVVASKGYPPPFMPIDGGDLDTSNFDTKFTEQAPTDSPVEGSLGASVSDLFIGFTYVAKDIEVAMAAATTSPRRSPRQTAKLEPKAALEVPAE